MKIKLKAITIIALFLISFNGFSQVTASFYTNASNSKFAIGYEFNEKFWTDLRIYSPTDFDNITPELVFNYNIASRKYHEIYLGAGGILNGIPGIVLPIGVAIKPFENMAGFSLNIEFDPTYQFDFNEVFIRGFVGIRYEFE